MPTDGSSPCRSTASARYAWAYLYYPTMQVALQQ